MRTCIVVSDTHCGDRMGLFPRQGVTLDEGADWKPTRLQRTLWEWWMEFGEWVDDVTKGEAFVLVHNGDAIDGVHHGSTHQITQNLTDQRRIARAVLQPLVDKATIYYHIRGTEAHVGKSAEHEEALAEMLGAKPNADGQFARFDLWLNMSGHLVHFLHHVGVTGSTAYEATAVHKELTEEFAEAARWGEQPPSAIVRSHRHRHIETRIPTARGDAIATVTPAWQLKTPFAWKTAGARLTQPQIGGVALRVNDEGILYTMPWVRHIGRSPVETTHNGKDQLRRMAGGTKQGGSAGGEGRGRSDNGGNIRSDRDARKARPRKAKAGNQKRRLGTGGKEKNRKRPNRKAVSR